MALAALPSAIRTAPAANLPTTSRAFHSSRTARASILFALGALSNSRETQHFNKLTGLSRVEHSPPLKLIQTSEVDPYPLPTPPPAAPRQVVRPVGGPRSPLRVWDDKALLAGRVLLADQARRTHRLLRTVARAKRREVKQNMLMSRDRLAWLQERRKMREDMRTAGIWILASIGTATALATWRFWPAKESAPDSGELGRKLAARASAAMPLPAAVSAEPIWSAPIPVATAAASPAVENAPPPGKEMPAEFKTTRSWWQGLFWKQH